MYASRASTVADSDSIAAVERSLSSLFACSSDTFCDWIVSAASRSFCAERWRVLEVRLLRLAHQEERQREDEERPDADRLVRLVDHGGDEAVDERSAAPAS